MILLVFEFCFIVFIGFNVSAVSCGNYWLSNFWL